MPQPLSTPLRCLFSVTPLPELPSEEGCYTCILLGRPGSLPAITQSSGPDYPVGCRVGEVDSLWILASIFIFLWISSLSHSDGDRQFPLSFSQQNSEKLGDRVPSVVFAQPPCLSNVRESYLSKPNHLHLPPAILGHMICYILTSTCIS